MNKIKKISLYLILTIVSSAIVYLYIWEKPKLEKYATQYIESLSQDQSIPFSIKIERTNFSIFPLQVEMYNTQLSPKKKLAKTLKDFVIQKISLRPSLIDLFVGKFWFSQLKIQNSKISLFIKGNSKSSEGFPKIEFNSILKRIPLSQLDIEDVQLNLNYNNEQFLTTENLFIRAYNEKSSLIVTIKDPNMSYHSKTSPEQIYFLTELQFMLTKNTLSLSKLKIVKESSYLLASGNALYSNSPLDLKELQMKLRLKSSFSALHQWSNQVKPNDTLAPLAGNLKTDINISKRNQRAEMTLSTQSQIDELQVGKVKIGSININADLPNPKQININSIKAQLAGGNTVNIDKAKIHLGEKTEIAASISIKDAELHSFLRDSGIADIPVWLKINGNLQCSGTYDKKLSVDCPGALTASQLKIKNKSRTKNIVSTKKIDISGNINITESQISYKANAQLPITKGASTGVIDFNRGFDISYQTDNLDFKEIGPIADLGFLGTASCKGSTQGDSHSAVFDIDIKSENFEFEKYFFGELNSLLKYKSGTLSFTNIDGNIESTRYNGQLNVDLLEDNIKGDIRFPFFRMEDVQQSIIKKVDLQQKFLGSGSGRLQLNTPFEVDQLSFILDARLFKGQAFGEDYNEAKLKAEAVDGIIILQQALLQREKSSLNLKGTIDTKLESQLKFKVNNGFLQHSSLIKDFKLPLAGEFDAQGQIDGPINSPEIKTTAMIKNLSFNKNKYGKGIFSYDNSKKQKNLQFSIPEQIDLLVVLPEENFSDFFIDLNTNKLDIAPIVSHFVSEEATQSYKIETSGEISGKINMKNFWDSEFSSTIKNVSLDYKSNKIETTLPTNIELKNHNLFLNEISLVGKRQFIKITQPQTSTYYSKFIINSRINIAFFKLLAPFIEKIDGSTTLRLEVALNRHKIDLFGSSYITDSFLKFPGFPHAFEGLSADILFNQNKVSINSIKGQVASGKVTGNGEVQFKNAKEFDLSINTNMENINLNFPKGFNTKGNASLQLSGDKLPFLLSGTYSVTGGLIDNNFDSTSSSNDTDLLEELLRKEIVAPLLLNIDVNTDKSLEVRNTLVEGYVEGNLKIYDKVTSPRIRGEIHFEDDQISTSIIRVGDNEFEVIDSSFVFEGQTPINPKLALRADSRVNGYDIILSLQGRANKPILTASSQPPLPQTQIMSMLTLGQLPDQFNRGDANSTDQNANSGFEIGTSLLGNNPLGKEIKDRTGFDVQFSSSFDEQSNSAVPKVTIRRRITKKLQLSFSQATKGASQTEGQVSYELNNQLSTIFRVNGASNDTNTDNGTTSERQNNPFGVDLEYKVEFD